MGFVGTALKVGQMVSKVGSGATKAESDSSDDSSSNQSGTTLMDKLTKWNNKRKQNNAAQKSAGANDLTAVMADPMSAKKGGMVKRTGLATIHEGERVLTKAQAKKYEQDKLKPKKAAPKKTAKKAGPRKRA